MQAAAEKPAMDVQRANAIVKAINQRAFFAMGIAETVDTLEGVTLADMLEAKEIVQAANKAAASIDGKTELRVVPDDRLIAAAYTLEHYWPDNEAIVVVPTHQWPYNRRALGVVGLEPSKETEHD
ncbi:hypothetical protein [Aminobacter sp. MDW-2]|uniref:hypothetical protein n=1 Tax=Aminobacter sp. MDW-2 TaxID=2666139 RepID=UPI0012B13D71|nr:hypothetical protein [Aminobacter sp. MDW-2]MRX32776.1 hypothetical protein [Aminobacter sp. MDW-2]QNH34562.1 hypothetical protein H5P29_00995 [Aminobacter sp. MDW-2]